MGGEGRRGEERGNGHWGGRTLVDRTCWRKIEVPPCRWPDAVSCMGGPVDAAAAASASCCRSGGIDWLTNGGGSEPWDAPSWEALWGGRGGGGGGGGIVAPPPPLALPPPSTELPGTACSTGSTGGARRCRWLMQSST